MREKDRETVRVSVPVSMNQHMLVIEYEEGLREGEREGEGESSVGGTFEIIVVVAAAVVFLVNEVNFIQ